MWKSPPALRGYVIKKFERISRHFEQLIDVHCVLTVEKLRHKAEATLMLRGNKIYADATEADMYAAIDALTDKLDRCVKKHKEKASDHHAEEVIKARLSLIVRVSMRLIIVSGLSGSGKSVALHLLGGHRFLLRGQYSRGAAQALHLPHRSAARMRSIRGPRSGSTRAIGPTRSTPYRRWSMNCGAAASAARCCICTPATKCC